jgi:predicted signal transduction protein with EAL and GGDEF domain
MNCSRRCRIGGHSRAKTLSIPPYDIAGRTVDIGTSIGIAIAPKDGKDPDELLKKADHALYRCEREGRGSFCFSNCARGQSSHFESLAAPQ